MAISVFTRCFRLSHALIGGTLLAASLHSFADMRVDRAIVYFEPDAAPRQDVEVSNLSDENLYLQVEVLEVSNAGTENEERKLVTDLDSIGFIASPATSVIAPNSKRSIRLLNLRTASDEERIYRVTFKPVIPELKASSNAIKLLVAYQSLVIIRPQNSTIDVASQSTEEGVELHNNGNANVFLQNGKACHETTGQCVDLPSKRLYAGNSWVVPNPPSLSSNGHKLDISYTLNSGSDQTTKHF